MALRRPACIANYHLLHSLMRMKKHLGTITIIIAAVLLSSCVSGLSSRQTASRSPAPRGERDYLVSIGGYRIERWKDGRYHAPTDTFRWIFAVRVHSNGQTQHVGDLYSTAFETAALLEANHLLESRTFETIEIYGIVLNERPVSLEDFEPMAPDRDTGNRLYGRDAEDLGWEYVVVEVDGEDRVVGARFIRQFSDLKNQITFHYGIRDALENRFAAVHSQDEDLNRARLASGKMPELALGELWVLRGAQTADEYRRHFRTYYRDIMDDFSPPERAHPYFEWILAPGLFGIKLLHNEEAAYVLLSIESSIDSEVPDATLDRATDQM